MFCHKSQKIRGGVGTKKWTDAASAKDIFRVLRRAGGFSDWTYFTNMALIFTDAKDLFLFLNSLIFLAKLNNFSENSNAEDRLFGFFQLIQMCRN